MRLSVLVNGSPSLTASIPGPGYLSAHVNLHDRPGDKDSPKISVVGFETRETETLRSIWPTVVLQVGDVIEVRILPEGDGDAPSEVQQSSESPSNLLSNSEFANEVVQAVTDFDRRLMDLVEKSEEVEPAVEQKNFQMAVGRLIYDIGSAILYPIFRRHTDLIPEGYKGELL